MSDSKSGKEKKKKSEKIKKKKISKKKKRMPVTEEERAESQHQMNVQISVISGVALSYLLSYSFCVMHSEGGSFIDAGIIMFRRLSRFGIFFWPNLGIFEGFFLGAGIGLIIYIFLQSDTETKRHYDSTAAVDTGGFMSREELQEYADEFISPDPPALVPKGDQIFPYDKEKDADLYSKNMIMSENFCRPINSRRLIGNNNVLVVGGAGTGKSRFFIKPNVLQMNASYVITDPSGEMIYSLGNVLRTHDYKIKIFNISDMEHSNCYNPLAYIRDEAGVKMLIECLIENTTKGKSGGDNQFFVDAEKLLYSACIFYLKDFCTDDTRKNFPGVINMINASSVDENNADAKSPLDLLFEKLPQSSLAWKYYKSFKQAAGKTLKSIIVSCVTRLQPFLTPQVANLTRTDNLDLGMIGKEKTALFIITPQADRTYAFLASMLYSQLFETLYHIGEQQKASGGSEQMDIPVRCLMDEFANIGEVPEFPSKLSTMRKYNISATIVLQDIAQIEAMYEDNWKTLVGNCSTYVFLGTQEPNTLKYFSEMLGQKTIRTRGEGESKSGSSKNYSNTGRAVMTQTEMGMMPSDECIVYTQNRRPVKDKKYNYNRHPYYEQTADAHEELGFQYNKLSIYDNSRAGNMTCFVRGASEAARVRRKRRSGDNAKAPENIRVSGDYEKIMEHVEMGGNTVGSIRNDIETMIAGNLGHPLCMIRIKDANPKYMQNAMQASASVFSLPALVVFNEQSSVEPDILTGYGYSETGEFLRDVLLTEETGKDGKSSCGPDNVWDNGKYSLFKIRKEDYEKYCSAVQNNVMKKNRAAQSNAS